jgi:hypothetical protein
MQAISEAFAIKYPADDQFGLRVLAANSRHHNGALFGGDNIGHGSLYHGPMLPARQADGRSPLSCHFADYRQNTVSIPGWHLRMKKCTPAVVGDCRPSAKWCLPGAYASGLVIAIRSLTSCKNP